MRALIDSVKQLDFQNKDLQNELLQINNKYEELSQDLNGERHLKRVKSAMVQIKKEIRDVSLNEGVVLNTLFTCTQMRAGKHHLYDDVLLTSTMGVTSSTTR